MLASGGATAAWQDIPDKIILQTMGDKLSVNGVPMSVRAFNTDLPAEEVVQLVQSAWERNKDRTSVTRTNISPWTILNQSIGNEHRSFQIKPSRNGGNEGFVALTSPAQARTPEVIIPLPPEVTAVQIVDSVDNGRSSQQIVAVSTRSADATGAALESSLRAVGWQRHVMKKQANAVVFAANRNGEELDAIISTETKGSLMMINIAQQAKR
jgi:hypothetical protein